MQGTAYGQKLFDLGVKGGMGMDNLSTDHAHQALFGWDVGIFTRIKPPLLPGVQGEALITSMGATVTVEGQTANIRSMSFLLPVFMVLSLGPVDLQLGGYYDVPLEQTWHLSGTLSEEGNAITLDESRPATYGLVAGAAIRLGKLYLGARYNYGMQDMATGPYLSDIRDRQTRFYVGWGFL